MKIVVVGGSGLVGTKLVTNLTKLRYTVVPASPKKGINTVTGDGLRAALAGADALIDVSNSPSFEDSEVMNFFETSTTNLLSEAQFAGVKHHVLLSVVGADRVTGSGYLRAKLAQENLVRKSGIGYSILRSTQFFEFAGAIANAATVGNEVRISPAAIQPIASDEVVAALIEIVKGKPTNTVTDLAGPVRMPMYEFIRYYLNATEDSRQLIMDEYATYFGALLNDESLVPAEDFLTGEIKYEDWFQNQQAKI